MADKVTIQQVAAAAGVSTSTVSNVLNSRSDRMQPETRDRVFAAIRALDYRPNRAARQLRTGQTKTIGLIVPSVSNPFWGAFARELEQAALGHGYNVLLGNSERDPGRELGYVEELWDNGVRDIVLCTSLPSLEHLAAFVERGLNLILFDRPVQPGDPPLVASIGIDNHLGGSVAASHLTDLGHRRIAFVSGSQRSVNRTVRHAGFLAAVQAAGLDASELPVWAGLPAGADELEAPEVGRRAVHELFSAGPAPTAIIAINDMTALGVCKGIRDLGLGIGTDVSVVGFDDIPLADLVSPSLTTVRQPIARMAALAVEQVVTRERTDDRESTPAILLRPELVVRDSTGAAPAEVARG
ncbi:MULTISPECIES: LacI family DNA-binding transcriptional regulator [unclassified Plantibacter]|uniref:LacI family DNA-binding transcriptional regulator n=1 Tax=unclassified Plantibacter TaxID=2624265 RepID=UPI0006F617D4|nr:MULTISPECIES: LacI family DNA-binding transcriptional regulator [unclassified Plantibacter]KQQ52772.1 LacI family transcriptional regulator [Plantibacter sp. Leaf314]